MTRVSGLRNGTFRGEGLVRWTGAALIAVAAHGIMFAMFSPPSVKTPVPPVLSRVSFIPPAPHTPDLRLPLLFYYKNPEAMVKPSLKDGYSAVISMDGIRELIPDPQGIYSARLDTPREKKDIEKIPVNIDSLESRLPKLWKLKDCMVALSPAPRPVPALPAEEFPVWRLKDGTRLPQIFTGLDELRAQVAELKPSKPTAIKMVYSGGSLLPRVRIETSSEAPALDMKALCALIRRSDLLVESLRLQPGDAVVLETVWRKEL